MKPKLQLIQLKNRYRQLELKSAPLEIIQVKSAKDTMVQV
jgi:hypothetical protein